MPFDTGNSPGGLGRGDGLSTAGPGRTHRRHPWMLEEGASGCLSTSTTTSRCGQPVYALCCQTRHFVGALETLLVSARRNSSRAAPWPRRRWHSSRSSHLRSESPQRRKRLANASRWRAATLLADSSPSVMIALACVAILSRRPGVQKSSRSASPISPASAWSTSNPVE